MTTEANPDSVTAADLEVLAAGGFTRVSVGMQSAVPHVLARSSAPTTRTAWRRPWPARGGRPGDERRPHLRHAGGVARRLAASLEAAIALEPDHVSAYALVVEEGTKLAAQVRRGEVPMPEGDDEADKYELADSALAQPVSGGTR